MRGQWIPGLGVLARRRAPIILYMRDNRCCPTGPDRGTADLPGRVPAVPDYGEHDVRGLQGRQVGHVYRRFGRTAAVPDARPVDGGGRDQFRRRMRPAGQVRRLRDRGQQRAVDHVRDRRLAQRRRFSGGGKTPAGFGPARAYSLFNTHLTMKQ